MGGICNGIALHSPGLILYCATYFILSDYRRAAMRIWALSEAGVIYIMTHDYWCGRKWPNASANWATDELPNNAQQIDALSSRSLLLQESALKQGVVLDGRSTLGLRAMLLASTDSCKCSWWKDLQRVWHHCGEHHHS